jgi:hypothetical protein
VEHHAQLHHIFAPLSHASLPILPTPALAISHPIPDSLILDYCCSLHSSSSHCYPCYHSLLPQDEYPEWSNDLKYLTWSCSNTAMAPHNSLDKGTPSPTKFSSGIFPIAHFHIAIHSVQTSHFDVP